MKKNKPIIMFLIILLISTNCSCIYGYENNDLVPMGQVVHINFENRYPVIEEIGDRICNKLEPKDIIVSINEEDLGLKEIKCVNSLVKKSHGNLELTIIRDNEVNEIKINSRELKKCKINNKFSGYGTITAMDSNGVFYGLSHNIHIGGNSVDISKGEIYEAKNVKEVKSYTDNIGYLYSDLVGKKVGNITKNGEYGIKGDYIKEMFLEKNALEVGTPVVGEAWILCSSPSNNEMKYCKINILEVKNSISKIEVLDEELINYRGGIVQGMSGSPIIQNNKIVGGVRSVHCDNPRIGEIANIESILKNLNNDLR